MGQDEVVCWLGDMHRIERGKYYTVKEIAQGLKDQGKGCNGDTEQMVRDALRKLIKWGQVEFDFEDKWRRAYRFNA